MCGRWTLADVAKLASRFKIQAPAELKPRYNISPAQIAPVILNSEPNKLSNAKWGLIPSWAKDEKIAFSTINARAESLLEKPAFSKAFKSQRCLIPADGFYEWKKSGEQKVPYRIIMKDSSLFVFAGIYDVWNGQPTFSIITVEANKVVSEIYNRMPAILLPEQETGWLGERKSEELLAMLRPYPAEKMKAYQVSSRVNNTRNQGPELIKPSNQAVLRF